MLIQKVTAFAVCFWISSSSNQFWNCWEWLLMTIGPTTCAKQRLAQFTMQQRTLRRCGSYWFTPVQRPPTHNWESNRPRRQTLPSSMKCFRCLECSIRKQCLLILQSLAVIVVDRTIGHLCVTKSGTVQIGFAQVGALQIQILNDLVALRFLKASSPLKLNADCFLLFHCLLLSFLPKTDVCLGP